MGEGHLLFGAVDEQHDSSPGRDDAASVGAGDDDVALGALARNLNLRPRLHLETFLHLASAADEEFEVGGVDSEGNLESVGRFGNVEAGVAHFLLNTEGNSISARAFASAVSRLTRMSRECPTSQVAVS